MPTFLPRESATLSIISNLYNANGARDSIYTREPNVGGNYQYVADNTARELIHHRYIC